MCIRDRYQRRVREVHAIRNPDSKEVIEVEDHIERIRDRPFNDTRYDIDTSKLIALGWKEEIPFEEGFSSTVRWYIQEALPSKFWTCLLYTSPSPRDRTRSRMPSSA
eukprot:TRINITY_DN7814_c0_g1_i1.p1 TRINITY_DN7814_c0_g1~~TRINITY_DN7814_c0_g1_i1.p1  ORF type:complete len:107 (-),score=43.40 TRINITY_DN7814_c0_g1_i1:31-351(-)